MAETYIAGDIQLKKCILSNYAGKLKDITSLVLEFNVFQDLFDTMTKCEVMISDAAGLYESFPIVGEEDLYLEFKTPTFDRTFVYTFRIYSMTERAKGQARSESYVLHGINFETVNNFRTLVSKSYNDLSITNIIKNIFENYLSKDREKFGAPKKTFVADIETLNNQTYVFAEKPPFEVINFLNDEAMAKNDSSSLASNFIFYERDNVWHHTTIDSLLSQSPVEDFYLADAMIQMQVGEKNIHPRQKIANVSVNRTFDTLENLTDGVYGHSVEIIDPISKQFKVDTFKYNEDYKHMAHIDDDKISFTNQNLLTDRSTLADINYKSAFIVSDLGSYSTTNNRRIVHEFIKYDISSRAKMGNIALDITVPGNTDIQIGDIVNLHIPSSSQFKDMIYRTNLLYNKKFLVGSINHIYNKADDNNKFYTVIGCLKDTYGKKIEEFEG